MQRRARFPASAFTTRSVLIWIGLFPAAAIPRAQTGCAFTPTGEVVPTEFSYGRVFVRAAIGPLRNILLYTDTGGGMQSLYADVARRLGDPIDTVRWTAGGSSGISLVARVPDAQLDPSVPGFAERVPGHLDFVFDTAAPPPEDAGPVWAGRLGSMWFADRVWTIDYQHQQLHMSGQGPAGPAIESCWSPLAFQVDSAGNRPYGFARIAARIDGETIQFLLDTGARTVLTDSARALIDPRQPASRATSFVITDLFERWHARHPDWPVIRRAERGTNAAMIRVPSVQIGQTVVGPVWFTERANENFHQFMSTYMDSQIDGALGGSAFQHGALVIDYPRARAALVVPP